LPLINDLPAITIGLLKIAFLKDDGLLLAAAFAGGAVAAGLSFLAWSSAVIRAMSQVDNLTVLPNVRFAPIIADSFSLSGREIESMMGPRQVDQAPLFYEFSLKRQVPGAHLLRAIDRFVDLSDVRSHLAPLNARLAGLPLIPNYSFGCCWLVTATAFVPNGGYVKRCT
jgi:hypothetical protein